MTCPTCGSDPCKLIHAWCYGCGAHFDYDIGANGWDAWTVCPACRQRVLSFTKE